MQAEVIQRQYDEVIASHYDLDPQSILGDSLDKALQQIRRHAPAREHHEPLRVLDLGLGTGKFLKKLRDSTADGIAPFGIDLSQKMLEIARRRLPDLVTAVDDAANLDAHFGSVAFDLICTHFITGFVPMNVLAPKIWARLDRGGYWSLVGGTQSGFPALQQITRGRFVKLLFKGRTFEIGDVVCNPVDQADVVRTLTQHGFEVCACETFRPALNFRTFDDFYTFAYHGGWLTPFMETLGLHRSRPVLRRMLNALFFPVQDEHHIVIALARKPLTAR
jgi:SAM-dependent methyltransferase